MKSVGGESPNAVFPEDRELVEKLAKLQDLHQQISDLRGLLPDRLLGPTRVALERPRSVSPSRLAASLRKAASDGSRDIQKFKKDFHSPEMRELWQKTGSSEYPQGRDSWSVDYQALVRGKATDNKDITAQTSDPSFTSGATSENEEAVVRQYEGPQSALKITKTSQSSLYPFDITVDGLSFRVIQQDKEGKRVLKVEQQSETATSSLTSTIADQINDRKTPLSLELLLSMLESYNDLKFKECEKCQSIFDEKMNYAVVRRQKIPAQKESKKIEWEVLHSNCSP